MKIYFNLYSEIFSKYFLCMYFICGFLARILYYLYTIILFYYNNFKLILYTYYIFLEVVSIYFNKYIYLLCFALLYILHA